MSAFATAAIAVACPNGVGVAPCTTVSKSKFLAFLQQAATSRFLPAYTTATGASSAGACSGFSTTDPLQAADNFTQLGFSLGLHVASSIAQAGTALASAIPVVGSIASLVTSVVGIFAAHHATAVKEQDSVLCQGVPAINNLLSQIDAGLQAGSITGAQALASYQSFQMQFVAAVKSDPSYKAGDALDGYLIALQVVIAARVADINAGNLTSGNPLPVATGAVATVTPNSSGNVTITETVESGVVPTATTPANGTISIAGYSFPAWGVVILGILVLLGVLHAFRSES